MKTVTTILIFLISGLTIFAQTTNPNFDETLAKNLGADDYGMKPYVLVILKTGENKTTNEEEINLLFRGHMENINRLVKENKLIVAGPLGKNDQTYRGIFILDVPTIEEAKTLVQTDPAVKEKLLDVELFLWYGSAALKEYLPAADKIWKSQP
ncbi:MAG TPA: YciI family protein [Draconibacterium sp.]|nr:YciI family protein [Draconibacterium sp.]